MSGGPRRARLYVSRVDAWSVAKAAFLLAIAIGITILVAMALLWLALDALGVFGAIARNVNEIVGSSENSFDLMSVLSFQRVMGGALVLASVEVVLVSVLAAVFAILYNLTVPFTGGIEVDLTDGE